MRYAMMRLAKKEQGHVHLGYPLLSAFVTLTALGLGLYHRAEYLIGLFQSQLHSLF